MNFPSRLRGKLLLTGLIPLLGLVHTPANACPDVLEGDSAALAQAKLVREFNKSATIEDLPDFTYNGRVVATRDPDFETIVLHHEDGPIPQDAVAQVLILHGLGTTYSNVFGLGYPVMAMGGVTPGRFTKTIPRFLRREDQFGANTPALAVRAINLPTDWSAGHYYGPDIDQFTTLEVTAGWLAAYLQKMKSQAPGLPVFVLARSASPALAYAAHKAGGNIDGLIAVGPTLPGRPDLLARGTAKVYEMARASRGRFVADPRVLEWTDARLAEIDWQPASGETFLGDLPHIVLIGSDDPEAMTEEIAFYEEHAHLYRVEAGLHNVVDAGGKGAQQRAGRRAYHYIYQFIMDPSQAGSLSRPVLPDGKRPVDEVKASRGAHFARQAAANAKSRRFGEQHHQSRRTGRTNGNEQSP